MSTKTIVRSSTDRVLLAMSHRPGFDFLRDLPENVLIEVALEVIEKVHDLFMTFQLVTAEKKNRN